MIIAENVKFEVGHYNEDNIEFYINNAGRFVKHSPIADSGLTGRKVVCDTYGGYAPIGGGSQSSKDYTKVDRTALYAAGGWQNMSLPQVWLKRLSFSSPMSSQNPGRLP